MHDKHHNPFIDGGFLSFPFFYPHNFARSLSRIEENPVNSASQAANDIPVISVDVVSPLSYILFRLILKKVILVPMKPLLPLPREWT